MDRNAQKNVSFVFTSEYRIDLAVMVCTCASVVFKQTSRKAREASDSALFLNRSKSTFWTARWLFRKAAKIFPTFRSFTFVPAHYENIKLDVEYDCKN